jgi:hypothetical protein
MKFADIIIPKSWFKKNCSEPVAGSKSLTCWLKDALANLPSFEDDAAALTAGLNIGDLYLNSVSGGLVVLGKIQTIG